MMSSRVIRLMFTERFLNQNNQARYFSRWVSRKPVKVIAGDEYDSENDSQIKEKTQLQWDENYFNHKKSDILDNSKPLTISKSKQIPQITMDMLETTIDEEGNFIYTKMKDNDSRITTILTQIKSNKERNKKDLLLVEGKRLIKDALDANLKLEYIIFSRFNEIDYLKSSIPKIGAKLYKMPYREIQMWSNLTTSPGIMAIFKIPATETYEPPADALPLTVICDNVREADNLGAILRACSAVGCRELLLTKGCVNVWDSKVLRSACGAHFKLRIQKKIEWDALEKYIPSNSNIFIADNKIMSVDTIDENNDKELLSNLLGSIPLVPYFGVDFDKTKHTVIIVGGETEGISKDSYELAAKLQGTRLNIPLGNNVDSLNVGTALGIIVFEIKRQFLISKNLK